MLEQMILLVFDIILISIYMFIGFIMFILIYGSTSTTSDFIYANF